MNGIPGVKETPEFIEQLGVFGGEYTDFNHGWYGFVGSSIALTMAIQAVVPHVAPLLKVKYSTIIH